MSPSRHALRCLTLGLLLTACSVDVEHGLSRLPDDAVAYRLRLRAHDGVDARWAELAALLPSPSDGAVVRWWQGRDGVWILQGQFPDVSSYTEHVGAAWDALMEVAPIASGARPPQIEVIEAEWEVGSAAEPIGEGQWTLWLDGPDVRGEPTREIAGRPVWETPQSQARIRANILPDPPPSLADFLVRGGPSLACALAGLALLLWVNRRTRRRRLGQAR